MMYDHHQRPYHQQQYRNAAENLYGVYLDSIELRFMGALFPAQREKVEKVVHDWAGETMVGLNWSRLDLASLELKAGNFHPDDLASVLADAHLAVAEILPYFAGRFDAYIPSSAGRHRF